jgi:hypothetical protein
MRTVLLALAISALAACAPADTALDTPHWRAMPYCNEMLVPGWPSACQRQPDVDAQVPAGCIDFAAARAQTQARRAAYEILCRDGVIDSEGRSATGRSRLADRVEVAAQVAANTAENPARRARAAEEVAILRALYAQAPPE